MRGSECLWKAARGSVPLCHSDRKAEALLPGWRLSLPWVQWSFPVHTQIISGKGVAGNCFDILLSVSIRSQESEGDAAQPYMVRESLYFCIVPAAPEQGQTPHCRISGRMEPDWAGNLGGMWGLWTWLKSREPLALFSSPNIRLLLGKTGCGTTKMLV